MPSPNAVQARTKDEQLDAWLCERDLLRFIQGGWRYVEPNPFQSNWHIEATADHLEAVSRAEVRRLIINEPPRHMKSLGSNVFFPGWVWAQDPDPKRTGHGFGVLPGQLKGPGVKFMYMSYDQSLTTRDSVRCRQLIESDWYRRRWGERFRLRPDQNTKTRFDTMHGGHRISTSFGGLATGEGGDIIIIDDPHNIRDVDSDTVREDALRVWDEVLPTRLNDPKTGVFIIIMQRSHERDLTGHIIAKELNAEILDLAERERRAWTHVCLPAYFEPDHPLGFKTKVKRKATAEVWADLRTEPGEPLWKQRFPETILDEWATRLGSHAAAGQLQQRPTAREGSTFKRGWFEIVAAAPACVLHNRVRGWDLAASTKVKNDPDYTVGVLMGRDLRSGIYYVLDVMRGRMSPNVVRQTIVNMATQDGRQTKVRIPKDPGATGIFASQQIAADLAGYVVHIEADSGSKETRAEPFAAQCEAGNVKLAKAHWNDSFLTELCAFGGGSAHDDQVDAATAAFRLLTLMPNVPLQTSYHS